MRIGFVCSVIVFVAVLSASRIAVGDDDAAERTRGCEGRVVRLEETLASLPEPRIGGPVPVGIEPASTSAGTSPVEPLAPTLAIGPRGELRLDNHVLPDTAALAETLDTLRRNWGILHPGAPHPGVIHVWADRELTIARLRAIVSGVRDHRIALLALAPSGPVALPPCPSSLGRTCARLPGLAAAARADAIGGVWRRSGRRCASLRTLSIELASAGARDFPPVLRAGLPRALRACECGSVDVDAIAYVAAVMVTNAFDPAVRALELPAPSEGDETTSVGAWAAALGG